MYAIEKIYTCQYLEHLKQPINSFCFNLKCQDKSQCCTICLMKLHKDHKERDCKTIHQILQMIDNDIRQMPIWISFTNQAFQKVEKVHDGLSKLILGQRDYLIELKNNMENPNFYLYNKDFVRLKNVNTLIRKMFSEKYKNFFLGILKGMMKITQTLEWFELFKFNYWKELSDQIDLTVNLEQIAQNDLILNNQIMAYCENQQCYDKYQCCHQCFIKNDKRDSIFEILLPLIKILIQTLNQWEFAVRTSFRNSQQIYSVLKEFLQTQQELFQTSKIMLQAEQFQQFMLKLKNLKKWQKVQEINNQNNNKDIFKDLIDKLLSLSKTINKQIESNETQRIFCKKLEISSKKFEKQVNNDLEKKFKEIYKYGKTELKIQFIGNDLASNNRYWDAIICYDEAIQLNPQASSAYLNKGIALIKLNCFEQAIIYLDQAIQLDPNCVQSFNNKGIALRKLNQVNDALICFDQSINLNPLNSFTFNNKGFALRKLNRFEDAIKCFDQAIKLDHLNSLAYYNKGSALDTLSRYEEAIICFDHVIKFDQNNSVILQRKKMVEKKLKLKQNQYVYS